MLDGRDDALALGSMLGLGVAMLTALAFLLVQRSGLFRWLERLPHRLAAHARWARLPELVGLHGEVRAIYRRPRALLAGFLWHCLGWVVGAGEAWLALWLLKRAREVVLAGPALLAWKLIERRAWRRRALGLAARPQPAD